MSSKKPTIQRFSADFTESSPELCQQCPNPQGPLHQRGCLRSAQTGGEPREPRKASPESGEVARRSRDGEVVAPHASSWGDSSNWRCDRQRGIFTLRKTFFRRNPVVFQGKMTQLSAKRTAVRVRWQFQIYPGYKKAAQPSLRRQKIKAPWTKMPASWGFADGRTARSAYSPPKSRRHP